MESTEFLKEVHRQYVEAFKSQNPNLLDVVFEIEGKKLYADKLRLSIISPKFDSMLSERSKNDIIPIKDYKFADFKEFLSFIYSGKCNFNDSNIMEILDMAAFYQIKHLKELCEEYLSKIEIKFTNVFKFMEISNKYLLKKLKKPIQRFINQNFSDFFKSYDFLNANKTVIDEFVTYDLISPDEIFQAVYEWAKVQAVKKQKESNEEAFNINDAIKTEMQEFLPNIQFKKMELRFFNKLAILKPFLFTSAELNDIRNSYVKFKITNLHGQSIFGSFTFDNTEAIELVKSLKDRESVNEPDCIIYWKTNCEIPVTPNLLKKRDGSKRYLIYDSCGDLCVKTSITIKSYDYLLAEMDSETDFVFTSKCKIEIE
uniref:BTB domain-containing protein n=1 Tax=Panagrolaimus davidi TaxID=227884 RepID=A0A914QBX1_9BILA